MLHTVLLILKIAGVILAAILGILILLACIVLFVPVRYEAVGKCGGTLDSLKGKAKVTWLLHLVRFDAYFKERKFKWRLRLAWKTKTSGQELPGEKQETAGNVHRKEKRENEEKSQDTGQTEQEEAAEIPESEEGIPETREESGKEPAGGEEELKEGMEEIPETEPGSCEADESPEEPQGAAGKGESAGGRPEGVFQKVQGFFQKIGYTVQGICDKIKQLLQKKDRLKEFACEETHKGAFLKVKKEAFKLLRRLKPSKVFARLRIGLDDPCATGQVLAGLSLLYPLIGEEVDVTPDFEKRMLQGNVSVKGTVRGYYFFILCWNLLWCGNVRRTYRDIKNFKFQV